MAKKKVEPRPKRKTGRKDLYTELDIPSKLEAITGWASQGMIDKEIAQAIGISRELFYRWKKDKPEFAEAVKKGKYESDGELIAKSFRNATGFYVHEEQGFKVKTIKAVPYKLASGKTREKLVEVEEIEIVELKRWVNGSPALAMFMMKNRIPEHYKDKVEADNKQTQQVMFVDNIPETDDDETTGSSDNGPLQ